MNDLIFCVYDRLAGRYGSVFSSPTKATAGLQFKNLFKQSPNSAKDFELCLIGSIDLMSGVTSGFNVERVEVDLSDLTENKN